MAHYVRYFLLLLVVLSLPVSAIGDSSKDTARTDHRKLELRQYDQSALKKLTSSKDFNYREQAVPARSLLSRLVSWLIETLLGGENKSAKGRIWNIFFLLLAIVIIVIVIRLKFKGQLRLFAPARHIGADENPQDIHEIDFEKEISDAIARSDYRLAVRMLYLYNLKRLDENELITWRSHKTNQTYIEELIDRPWIDEFKFLTRQYEFTWYGNHTHSLESFNHIERAFYHFRDKVK